MNEIILCCCVCMCVVRNIILNILTPPPILCQPYEKSQHLLSDWLPHHRPDLVPLSVLAIQIQQTTLH